MGYDGEEHRGPERGQSQNEKTQKEMVSLYSGDGYGQQQHHHHHHCHLHRHWIAVSWNWRCLLRRFRCSLHRHVQLTEHLNERSNRVREW